MATTALITADTWAKQDIVQAATLSPDKKLALKKGEVYEVISHTPAPGNHRRVTFSQPLNGKRTWLIYDDHIQCDGEKPSEFELNVPYYSQRDNKEEYWRTCNTSSCAMVAEYLKPGCIQNSDDCYYQHVIRYGDTTDHSAQGLALASIGIESEFRTDLGYLDLDTQLEKNSPVVIGVLHRGTLANPSGGHMIVVIGKYKDGYICHDPWGEGFSYESSNGRSVRYPYSSLNFRWLDGGSNTGWGRIFSTPPVMAVHLLRKS